MLLLHSSTSEACIRSVSELAFVADFVSAELHFEIVTYDN